MCFAIPLTSECVAEMGTQHVTVKPSYSRKSYKNRALERNRFRGRIVSDEGSVASESSVATSFSSQSARHCDLGSGVPC